MAALVAAAAFLPTVLGHEGHHMDKIPEGMTVSPDPIVRPPDPSHLG
jgi:hypothetical protein